MVPQYCPTCRYDLRGATGPLCSECGTAFEGEYWPAELVPVDPPPLEYGDRPLSGAVDALVRGIISPRRWVRSYNLRRPVRWRRVFAYLVATEVVALGLYWSSRLTIFGYAVWRFLAAVIVEFSIFMVLTVPLYVVASSISRRKFAVPAFVRVVYLYRSVYILIWALESIRQLLYNFAPNVMIAPWGPELYFLHWPIRYPATCTIVSVWWFAVSRVAFGFGRLQAAIVGLSAPVLLVIWRSSLDNWVWRVLEAVIR